MNAIVTVTAMKAGLKNSYFFSTIVNVHIYSYPLFIVHTYKPFINNIFSSIDSVSSLYSTSSRQLILCPLAIWKGHVFETIDTVSTGYMKRVYAKRLSAQEDSLPWACLRGLALFFGYPKTPCFRAECKRSSWAYEQANNQLARRHGVFGYPKQSATAPVGSVLKWRASSRRQAQDNLSSRADEEASAREDSLSSAVNWAQLTAWNG
jgi:hypothetical protein